jgi:hypothetical protein
MAEVKTPLTFQRDLHDQTEAILTHFTNTKKDLDKLVEWLKDRSDYEKDYGKSLIKAKTTDFDAKSTVVNVWAVARTCVAAKSKTHLDYAEVLKQVATSLDAIAADLKKSRSKASDDFARVSKDRDSKESDCKKAFEKYEKALQKADQCYDALQEANRICIPKNISAAEAALKDGEKGLASCYEAYKKAEVTLRASQEKYYKVVSETLAFLEQKETDRLNGVQREMVKFATAHNALSNEASITNEAVNKTVTSGNPSQDLQTLIQRTKSRDFSPGYVKFYEFKQLTSTKLGHGVEKGKGPEKKEEKAAKVNSSTAPIKDSVPVAATVVATAAEPEILPEYADALYDYSSDNVTS